MKGRLARCILILLLLLWALPVQALEKEERLWQDEMVYSIMIDRFNNSSKDHAGINANDPNAYNGGDFQGIIDRLGYIKDMGFTAIMLSPVVDNVENGYHGYWVNDYYKTEEHFGTMKKFKELVNKAHNYDMKVIVDFPANSVGENSKLVREKGEEWFNNKEEAAGLSGREQQLAEWVDGLPDLNHENPDVKQYLIDAAKWWIKETSIDGYRLSAADRVPASFWTAFEQAVKEEKENFYLIADLNSSDPGLIQEYKNAGFNGYYDYTSLNDIRKGFSKPDQELEGIFTKWEHAQVSAQNPFELGTFVDNENSVRFTRDIISNNIFPGAPWMQALTYLFTAPGIPIVYYGSEIALDGGEAPDNRKLMNFRSDKELIDHIGKLSTLRQKLPSLTRGTMEKLYEQDGVAVFKREYDQETAIIAINNSSKTQKINLDAQQVESDGMELRGLLMGDEAEGSKEGYTLILDREESEVYVLMEKQGLNLGLIGGVALVWILFAVFLVILAKRSQRKNNA
ncbi:alpha-amlyase [Bacillus sp. FJAT-27225]|uniref:alpha-amylase family glycosyl hydrolase n=1 Tax=Bacillus sp. FJAT-27225 TaxID=1743144 RepID=UPI00080C23ED|nr:alpha-amylase family glycosyl hydrolase [Bacillus sp. FJAT-27225]OCA84298.1 alpha-amlyase [Bacillus sp. FJAT-27225]